MKPPFSASKKRSFQRTLLLWYRENGRDLPWRKTHNPYHILVSELMLQQTQVDRVKEKYREWLKKFPTTKKLAAASSKEVVAAWQGLGYNRRALYLHRIAQIVENEYGGRFPNTLEGVLALPGIGPYTAGAIMSFAFRVREALIDTNVKRILIRVFFGFQNAEKISDEKLWEHMRSMLPVDADVYDFNQGLMDFGAMICTAKAPQCGACPIQKICASFPEIQSASTQALRLTKKANEKIYFGQPRRIWRGKILKYVHDIEPRSATLLEIGNAIQTDFDKSRLPWLDSVIDVLVKDGFVKRNGKKISL